MATILTPPSVSGACACCPQAHSYEPTPQDIIRIQNCDLLVCNGGESEAWLDEILGGMGKEIPTVVMLDCVDALTEEEKDGMQVHEHHDHDHDHDEHDDDDHCSCGHHHDHDEDDDEHEHEHHHHDHDEHDHEHGDHCCCGHHHHDHHADEVFTSWGVETARKFTKAEVEHALTELDTGNYGMILRSKGIVDGGADGWLEFDYVPGEWEVRSRSADVGGKLVVIGSKLNETAIAQLFGC